MRLFRQQPHCRDPPCRVGEVLDFFGFEGAVEDVAFAVGEPFFEDLVAAQFVGPDGGGTLRQKARSFRYTSKVDSPSVDTLSPIAAFSSDV